MLVLAAIGLVPVRPGGGFARRFACRPHDEGNVGIRKHQASWIERSRERWIFEPPKPSSQFELVEPQRRVQECLEKPVALRCVEPRAHPPSPLRLDQCAASRVNL
jgi:hypothetical protein